MDAVYRMDEIKRKLRRLKKLEVKIRFNGILKPHNKLIWDQFFELRETNNSNAKYSLRMLVSMSREEYESVMNEYSSMVYYEYYKDNGMAGESGMHDPVILSNLGLPCNADEYQIKKKIPGACKEIPS